jgi:hypothetical protein
VRARARDLLENAPAPDDREDILGKGRELVARM